MEEPRLIKKLSLTDKAILRQKKILIVAVMFVVTLFIGSSYALLTNFDKTSEVINIKVGNMNASVTTNESISLENKLPETDASGKQNATPVEITITNTGTINIQKYEIKLLSEEGKTSTLEYQYIKYAISLDGTNYLEAKNLNDSNNIVYTGYNLKTDNNKKTKIIYLKVWIDETAGNNGLNKTFYGALSVDLYQKAEVPGSEKILEVANSIPSCTRTVTDTDGTVYISGNSDNPSIYSNAITDDCVIDFNYVWWSGKMWRITAIYPDGAMKMITDNMITLIAFNAKRQVNYYTKADETNGIVESKSYMFQWLNEDFLDTLYNNGTDVIDTTKYWNATMPSNTTISTKPAETEATMIPTTTSPVGLLNSYEYYKSYQNTSFSNGYLNIGYCWWLLNHYDTLEKVWRVKLDGEGSGYYTTNAHGSRPSIYLKSGISLLGSGTKENPYHFPYDYDAANTNDEINTRHSGEYVKLKNNDTEQLFRIVDIENNKTKIVAMDYADNKAKRKFATSEDSADTLWGSGTTTDTNTWYTYLNNTYYPNLVETYGELFDSNLYYLGTSSWNYKLSVCANTTSGNTRVCDKTSQTGTFDIGLLRYGEMFATQLEYDDSSAIDMWLINRIRTSGLWVVLRSGFYTERGPTDASGARPTVHLKPTVKILSGTGTELDPYVVGL